MLQITRFVVDFDQNGNIIHQEEIPPSAAPSFHSISLPPPPPPINDETHNNEGDLLHHNESDLLAHDTLPQQPLDFDHGHDQHSVEEPPLINIVFGDLQTPSFAPDTTSFILTPDGNFVPAYDDDFFEKEEFIDNTEKEVMEKIHNDKFTRELIEQIKSDEDKSDRDKSDKSDRDKSDKSDRDKSDEDKSDKDKNDKDKSDKSDKRGILKKRHVGRPTKEESNYFKKKKEMETKQVEDMKEIQSLVKVLDKGEISLEEFANKTAAKARLLNDM